MPNKKYAIQPVEITGQYAMFSNPCGGSQLSSFPFPTPTAIKGIIETIHFMPSVIFRVTRVHICNPIKYDQFCFNASVSHLRKSAQITDGNSLQRRFSVLRDVRYQIFGYFENLPKDVVAGLKIKDEFRNNNHAHACQEIFNRRLSKGAYTHSPHLGKRPFQSSYCGPVLLDPNGEPISSPCKEVNITVPSMPLSWFDKQQLGSCIKPSFLHNVSAIEGVVVFDNTPDSELVFSDASASKGVFIHA